jgi:hypothetical protein
MVVKVELLHIHEDKFDNFSNICKKFVLQNSTGSPLGLKPIYLI